MPYVTILVVIVIELVLDRAQLLPFATSNGILARDNLDIYALNIGLAFVTWFLLRFLQENHLLRHEWMIRVASPQGTARYLDVMILFLTPVCLVFAVGYGTLSPYLLSLALGMMGCAVHSLVTGQDLPGQQLDTVNTLRDDAETTLPADSHS